MPLTGSSSAIPQKFSDPIADYSPTILERITAAPFNLLDAPANATRSIIRAVQEGSWSDAGNAVKSMIPFAGSEEVPISDITGTEDFWPNLAASVFTDPTLLIGNVAGLTEKGAAAALVLSRANAVKVAEKLGTIEKLAKAKSALKSAEVALEVATKANPTGPARNLIKFAGKEVGDFETVKKIAGVLNPMPDVRRAAYQNEIAKVGRELKKGVKEEGEIYYHGTPTAFDKFGNQVETKGVTDSVFGSIDPDIAHNFVSHRMPGKFSVDFPRFGKGEVPNIRPFKVVGKILEMDTPEYDKILKEFGDTLPADLADHFYRGQIKTLADAVYDAGKGTHTWEVWESKSAIDFLKGKGYSAVHMQESAGKTIQVFDHKDIIPMSSEAFTPKYTALIAKQAKLQEELSTMHKGVIPIDTAAKIRGTTRRAAALFKHSGNSDLIETAKDMTMSNAAKAERDLGLQAAVIIGDIETVAREHGISVVQQQERLLQGAEFRKTLSGNAPDIEKVVLEKSNAAYEKYQKDLVKANKVGKVKEEGEIYYHGTRFEGDRLEANALGRGKGTGVFFSKDPNAALGYAENANMHAGSAPNLRPVKIGGKVLKLADPEYADIAAEAEKLFRKSDHVLKTWKLNPENTFPMFETKEAIDLIKSKGYSGIEFLDDGTRSVHVFDAANVIPMSDPRFTSKGAKILERQAKALQTFQSTVNKAKLAGEDARIGQIGFLEKAGERPYTAGEINTMDKILNMYEGLPQLERDNLIISSDLKSSKGLIEYSRRLLSDDAKKLNKKNQSLFSLIYSEYGARIGAAKMRKLYPEKDILTINKLVREDYGINFDFFSTDVVKAMMERRTASNIAVGRSQYLQFALDNMAKPGLTKSEGYTAGFFAKMVNGSKGKDVAGTFDSTAFAKKYKGLRIEKSLAHEILGADQILKNSIFNNNEGLNNVMKAVEYVNAPFRGLLTSPFPGFHHRNKIGNIINSWIGGINPLRQIKFEFKAGKLLKAIHTGEATSEQLKLMDTLIEHRVLKGGLDAETTALFKRYGLKEDSKLSQLMNRPLSTLTGLGKDRQFDLGTGRAYGKYVEDTSRIAHFMAKMDSGSTTMEAMRSVNKYLFDYSKLTNFEKKVARPTVLFYSWLRNNIPLQLRTVIDHPRVLESYNILTGQNSDDVPQYLRGSSSFRAPWSENTVIGSLGLPQEDLNIGNVAAADPGGFQQVSALADNFITRLSPALRIPIELTMGRTTFGRKNLQDLTPAQMLKEFTPISRFVTAGKKVVDPEIDMGTKMIDLLTGIRTYQYDPDRVHLDKLKRAALKSNKFYRSGFLVLAKEQNKKDEDVRRTQRLMSKEIQKLNKKRDRNE